MKYLFFAIIFGFLSFQTPSYSKDRLQNMAIESKDPKNPPKIVELNIPIDLSDEKKGNCHVRLTDIYGAVIGDGGYRGAKIAAVKSRYNELGFSFFCFHSDDGKWKNGLAVRFDNTKNKWIKDMSNRIDSTDLPEVGPLLDKATRVYNIQAANSQGFIITEDDFIGDESRRDRMLTYCLIHEPKVVCGRGPVMRLADPKSNLLPYALRIIQSIEFID